MAFEAEVGSEIAQSSHVYDVLGKTRTFNVEEGKRRKEECLCCARCGHEHLRFSEVRRLPSKFTPTTLDEAFTKTPLRVLLLLRASSCYFYTRRTYRDPDGSKDKLGYVLFHHDDTYNEKTPGVKALNYLHDMCARLCSGESDVEIDQRNVIVVGKGLNGEGEKARDTINKSSWPCANKFEWYHQLDIDSFKKEIFNTTYDLVLHLKLVKGCYMRWTDSNSIGTEEYMVLSWLCSGGNMLFGQWGLPKDVGRLNGVNINMDAVVEAFRGDVEDTNKQNTLADLAEWGHFLGWWGSFNQFPGYAEEKVKEAILQRKYCTWKFRKDFPHYTFTYTYRECYQDSRVVDMQDAYTREEDQETTLYGIARKKSRVLFKEGLSFFQRLIQRSLSPRNQDSSSWGEG